MRGTTKRTAVPLALIVCALGIVPLASHAPSRVPGRPAGAVAAGMPALGTPPPGAARRLFARLPLSFVPNVGRDGRSASFSLRGASSSTLFTAEGAALTMTRPGSPASGLPAGWTTLQRFPGSTPTTPVAGTRARGIVSFFSGPRASWKTRIPTYASVTYPGLWPGIDLTYSGASAALEYTFDVAPGADPARIRIAYEGARTGLTAGGDLRVVTPVASFTDRAPVAYQIAGGRRVPVTASFVALDPDGSGYGFRLGAFDHARPLVIDPVMIGYAGYIGGDAYEDTYGIGVDAQGHAYVMGATKSSDTTFPVKVGPSLHYGGKSDAFVCKVEVDGSALDYCGYIGGTQWDRGRAIAVDSAGDAYVIGHTKSSPAQGFPVTVGPNLTFNGNADAFVCKIVPDGTSLDYCGYIGGHAHDEGKGIAVDAAGNAYVTGGTHSTQAQGFPVTGGPDLTQNGMGDVWVAKVSADGTHLVYCGYIGGSQDEHSRGIGVDANGNAYVSGSTASSQSDGFPLLVGPDLTFNGARDSFVSEVSADGTHLVYSGYLGGSGTEETFGLQVDATGEAYIAGSTNSKDGTFPVVVGPDLTYNGGPRDAFVTEVAAGGGSLVYSGFIGGKDHDDAHGGLALAASGAVFVTGATRSTQDSFPVTGGPDGTYNGGATDAYVCEVRPNGSGFVFCGYIGGGGYDQGRGVAVGATGTIYVCGITGSRQTTFPVQGGPDLTYNGGTSDAFVATLVPG